MTPAQADAELAGLRLAGPRQAELLAAYRDQLAAHPGAGAGGTFAGSALHRDGPPAHLTASALVLSADGDRALLLLHRKAGAWLQPGGHLEAGDPSLAAAALREASEETGLGPVLQPAGGLVDLHHHALGAAFGRCREHLDVAFVLTAPDGAEPVVSAESEHVAWFALDALPEGVAADVPPRLRRAAALLRGLRAQDPTAGDPGQLRE
ncbi:NUDIX domain-containing protein [Streptomyces sp. NP160]|uniref:NUDIX hydrolase n=1 Tax=Streptomyces sp. NP160 TaxID=2586637 RepID=UPI001118C972|nr:NUDIX domain-containing protein [Streptomyces sp. NP160]TNM60020.1 NUDIX domain-containing protein [Streptomyces sp. NP160]